MNLETVKDGQRRWKVCALGLCAAGWLYSVVGQQAGSGTASNSTPAAASGTNVAAIPLANVAAESESAFASLSSIEDSLSADSTTSAIEDELSVLTRDTSARLEESSRMLASSPSLETLRRLNGEWQAMSEELSEWNRNLAHRMAQLSEEQARLTQMNQVWQATLASGPGLKMPPELLQRVERVLAAVKRTQEKAQTQQMSVLTIQTRVSEQDGRAHHVLNSIARAREAFLRRLFIRDGPPIWSPGLWSETSQSLVQQSHHSLSRQMQALDGYFKRKGERLILQGIVFLAICFSLIGAGRRLRRLDGGKAGHTALIFEAPVITALVLTLLASSWIYPQAPRLWWAILGAAALIPTMILVRQLIDRRFLPVLNALVIFYFLDQLRVVAASQALLSRVLALTEMLAGTLLVGWLLATGRLGARQQANQVGKYAQLACQVAFGLFLAAFVTNVLGYVTLSKLVGHALLQGAYMGLVLYAVLRIFDGLFLSALSVPPLSRLGVVARHRELLQTRLFWVLNWTAILFWAVYVLETVSLRAPVFQDLRAVLTATWGAGAFKLSLGDILLFGITIWAAFLISRILRFVLEEEVYPRVQLAPGLHYSISKMVNYAILVLGFFIGLAMLGLDLTRLTILVGAFGVGLGFGLQNIINNFVSGLILLFERPIKVGDVVQLAGNEGVVKHIGIRASIVRVANGSEIIVPNGSLISETVTNWTFSDRLRRLDLPVAITGPADPRQVMELLEGVAAQQPLVIKTPPPRALLVSFSGDAMNFELRFWTNQSEDWSQIRSELATALRAALAEHKITVK